MEESGALTDSVITLLDNDLPVLKPEPSNISNEELERLKVVSRGVSFFIMFEEVRVKLDYASFT